MLSSFLKTSLLFALVFTAHIHSHAAKTVLVTGGAGYIGSHTCKTLHDHGFFPVTFDNLDSGQKDSVKWGPLVVGDLSDEDALDEVFETFKPIAVIHFAALRSVADSVSHPETYYTNNVKGSINLLNCMIKHHVPHVIFSSSCTVYGSPLVDMIQESQPKNPLNPYAKSKYYTENIIADYANAFNFKFGILRYFNAAGIDLESGLKRSPSSCNFLIPRVIESALGTKGELEVYGQDHDTKDGTCIRDYIHVKDLARAHVLALNYLLENQENLIVNLGSGQGHSVLDVIKMVEEVSCQKVPFKFLPKRDCDAIKAVADPQEALKILNFSTQHSDLRQIVESEWQALAKP